MIGCKKCENSLKKGYLYYRTEDGQEAVKECTCLKEYKKELYLELKLERAGIPSSIVNYKISSYLGMDEFDNIGKINKIISNFDKYKNISLYWQGVHGTQKSTLARYTIRELLKLGYGCCYALTEDLIKLLSKLDQSDEDIEKIDEYLHCDFLVIDEFSSDKVTLYKSDYQIPFITSFLKKRYEVVNKSTVVISNYDIMDKDKGILSFSLALADLISRESQDILKFYDNYQSLKSSVTIQGLWD